MSTKKDKIKLFLLANSILIPIWLVYFGLHAGIKMGIYAFFGLIILMIFTRDEQKKDSDDF